MDYEKKIDIPFGAHDSELKYWEYTIPEGMEAEIKDGKVIVREKASEDERIREWMINQLSAVINTTSAKEFDPTGYEMAIKALSWLEKQKEQKSAECGKDERIRKALVEYHKQQFEKNRDQEIGLFHKDAVAYLEKQKINTEGDFGRGYDCGYEACLNSHGAEWFEKQKDFAADEYWRGFKNGRDEVTENPDRFNLQEKQKEQKPVKCELEDAFKYYTDAGITVSCGDIVVKPKEQKPKRKRNKPKESWLSKAKYELAHEEELLIKRQKELSEIRALKNKEQKPAEWSEEDREMLIRCVAAIPVQGDEILPTSYLNKLRNWLESLPERFNFQSKQEWSEEDITNGWTGVNLERYLSCLQRLGTGNPQQPETINSKWFKEHCSPQPREEIYQSAKHDLAIRFMNYLDENRPEGKMCLSNGECEDIDKAFKENDWAKIMQYVEKYRPSWKPSEEQMDVLNKMTLGNFLGSGQYDILCTLYEDLKKLI